MCTPLIITVSHYLQIQLAETSFLATMKASMIFTPWRTLQCLYFSISNLNRTSQFEIWYTKETIGKNTLVNIMKQISGIVGLSQTHSNHCARASTFTRLYQAGADTQQRWSITKHKNESNLSHYISSTSDKQQSDASSRTSSSTFVPSSISTGNTVNLNDANHVKCNITFISWVR